MLATKLGLAHDWCFGTNGLALTAEITNTGTQPERFDVPDGYALAGPLPYLPPSPRPPGWRPESVELAPGATWTGKISPCFSDPRASLDAQIALVRPSKSAPITIHLVTYRDAARFFPSKLTKVSAGVYQLDLANGTHLTVPIVLDRALRVYRSSFPYIQEIKARPALPAALAPGERVSVTLECAEAGSSIQFSTAPFHAHLPLS